MNCTITNLGTVSPDDDVYLTQGQLSLAAGASVTKDTTLADLDADEQLKGLIAAGQVSVAVVAEAIDAVAATTGSLSPHALPKYTVAGLPTGFNGRIAYATNGRSGAEGAGLGTGVPVIFTNAAWRRFEDMAAVAA